MDKPQRDRAVLLEQIDAAASSAYADGKASASARITTLEALLVSALEYLESYEDVVDGAYGESSPNAAMSLASAIREVLPMEGK